LLWRSGGEEFTVPAELSTSGGTASASITVSVADITIDWLIIHRRVFNGGIPGPTVRVRRGDRVNMTLVSACHSLFVSTLLS